MFRIKYRDEEINQTIAIHDFFIELEMIDQKLLAWKARGWLTWSRGILCDWFMERTLLSLVGPELEADSHRPSSDTSGPIAAELVVWLTSLGARESVCQSSIDIHGLALVHLYIQSLVMH